MMKEKSGGADRTAELRRRATEKVRMEPPALEFGCLSVDEVRHLFHDLRVHQIELEMQNEELRRAQWELDAARTRYFLLFDMAPVGYFTVGENGLIMESNLTGARLLGLERADLVKRPLTRFILPEDQDVYYLHRKSLFETGASQVCEFRMLRRDDSPRWMRLDATLAHDDESGEPVCRVVISDIHDRKQTEMALVQSLKEKEVLLREIHHRVKNNMQVVNSLLSLQMSNMKSDEVKEAIQDSQSRIKSMALVHEMLYGSDSISDINLEKYLAGLAGALAATYSIRSDQVRIEFDLEAISISIDQASHLGLIMNELIANALKHAFAGGRKGRLAIEARSSGPEIEIAVSDDGVGFPEGFDWRETDTLGLRVLRILTEGQLEGTIELESGNGTRFTIRFPAQSRPRTSSTG